MEKREDRRIMMTKRMLKSSLIEMLKEKDIYHISIRELCEKADVNRTTFYKYYGSQFDLLTDMENDLLNFINKAVTYNEQDPEKIILAACKYLEENIEFVRLIVNSNVTPSLPGKLLAMDSIKEIVLRKVTDVKNEAELDYLYNFLMFGSYRAMCVWLNKERREPPELFAKLIMDFISR